MTTFDKTLVLLKNQQDEIHKMGAELRALKDTSEFQTDTYQEVLATVRNLGLSTIIA